MKKMSESALQYILSRMLDNANDTMKELKNNPKDLFYQGKQLAYYEMIDTIKNELEAHNQDLKEYGLDFDLEDKLL
ncbi:hypothetical protein [Allisonella histaminiformans]|uniref:hypothetical protein n=2 Tax=Allisonella TaxID=209879 RepID=UPI0025960C16|nr:hypothetical protein [uncultured Allisonella sp.]